MKLLRLILPVLALTGAAACDGGRITGPDARAAEPAYLGTEQPTPDDSEPSDDGTMGSGAGRAGE